MPRTERVSAPPAGLHRRVAAAICLSLAALLLLAAPAQAKFGFVTKWGSLGDGNGQFAFPRGVATDAAGNVYVVDWGNRRIQKFTSNGTFITKWGSFGDGNEQFGSPSGLATDTAGNVYVVDSDNNRIQKFTSNGTFITKWVWSPLSDGNALQPWQVATDAGGNVYVTDIVNDRVQKLTSNGTFITEWGSKGSGNGQFDSPRDLATDAAGNVYVTDTDFTHDPNNRILDNNRIQKFTSNGTFITKWGTFGDGNGQFNGADGVTTDAAGNVYVADVDNARIQKFTSNGTFITKWGSFGDCTFGCANGEFAFPQDVATDAAGNVYVADTNSDRIQKFGIVPAVTITKGAKGKTRKRRATFRFRSDEPGSTFACRLDKRNWQRCTSPVRYRKLTPGRHVFRVRGTTNGNTGPVAKRRWRVKSR